MKNAVHFVGFMAKEQERFNAALRVFGTPDFVHPGWDMRAALEVMPGDVCVFAQGDERDVPRFYPYQDEAYALYVAARS